MTENPIRVSQATDTDRYLATDQTVWFQEVYPAPAEQQLVGLPEEYRFAAEIDGADASTYPGVYGVFPMTLAVPGPDAGAHQVPCAGLSWVGVHPDHRRRGVLSAMMRHHLEQVHEEPGTTSRPCTPASRSSTAATATGWPPWSCRSSSAAGRR